MNAGPLVEPLDGANTISASSDKRIGLIAGWGRYPILVAAGLRRKGYQVYCLGITGHADWAVAEHCRDFRFIGLARMGAHIRFFRRHGVQHVTMAGKIHKVLLFNRHYLWQQMPDLKSIRTFFPHFITSQQDRRDDTLLTAAIDGYRSGGLEILPATDLVPDLLIKPGQFSGGRLSDAQRQDIQYGWKVAKQMGRLDIGQSVAVKGQSVLALEAIEGTDQCIRRAGQLCKSGGFTIVKVAKPRQDMRFDVPTIGLSTLQTMVNAGAKVLAVEAHKTILVDQAESIDFARRHDLHVVALRNELIQSKTMRQAA